METPMSKLDYNLLSDIFPSPVRKVVKRRPIPMYATPEGRVAYLEKQGRQWAGWYQDDHSATYLGYTKSEVMTEMNLIKKV